MFRQTRLAAQAAGSEACVHDAPSADLVPLIPPKWRKKPPEPEPQAPEGRALLQDLRRDEADGALQEVRQRRGRMCKLCDAKRARERYRADLEGSRASSRAYRAQSEAAPAGADCYAAKPDHYRALARAYAH